MFTQIYTSYWSFYTVFLQFIHDFEQLFYVLYLIAHQSVTENCHLLKPDHFLGCPGSSCGTSCTPYNNHNNHNN